MMFMSSKDDLGEDGFEVRPLRWRSQTCDKYFMELDEKTKLLMSAKAKRQMAKRSMGPFSGRGTPQDMPDSVSWAVRKEV